jgi:serine/threonine protein kinase
VLIVDFGKMLRFGGEIRRIGKYDIVEVLGRGGMGVVYRGVDKQIGREVAIKTLTEGYAGDAEMLRRFYEEGRRTGQLNHPNIVTVFDLGDDHGIPYIVMELVQGKPLDKLIASGAVISMADRLRIVQEVCSALAYAHLNKVIHRDVKPANIFVLPNGTAKLLDFGIGRADKSDTDSPDTRTGVLMGTIPYMSPERLLGNKVDGRSDIFAAGVVLYQLVTGKLPFTGTGDYVLMHQILNEPPLPMSAFVGNCPPALEPIVDRALKKAPSDRYHSAEEMAIDLAGVIAELRLGQTHEMLAEAGAHANAENFPKARAVLNELLMIDRKNIGARELLARIEGQVSLRKREERAQQVHLQAEDAMSGRRFEQSLKLLEESQDLFASNPELAALREKLQKEKERQDSVNHYLNQAESARHKGDYQSAICAAEKAFEIDCTDPKTIAVLDELRAEAKGADQRPPTQGALLPVLIEEKPAESPRIAGLSNQTDWDLNVLELPIASDGDASLPPSGLRTSDQTIVADRLSTQILRSDLGAGGEIQGSPIGSAGGESIGNFVDESTRVFSLHHGRVAEAFWISDPPSSGTNACQQGSPPRAKLTFVSSADPLVAGMSVSIPKVPFLIGRSSECNLSIPSDPALSRQHCAIDWSDGAYLIRDLESNNGTWLNGRSLRGLSEILLIGSLLRLSASTVLAFQLQDLFQFPVLTGCVINERYRLIEPLRVTAKSALYMGADNHLPQAVAVKILSPDLLSHPGYIKQFNQEAELAVRLRHAHIARALDFGPASIRLLDGSSFDSHFVVTEYHPGGNLTSRIGEDKFMKPSDVAAWLSPISKALDFVHAKRMVHGGLKSTSVIFDESSNAYLTDFAFASHSDDDSRASFIGSPDFMAPEQWEGLKPTPLTDQYSLAVLAYCALVGGRPFEGQMDPMVRKRNFARGAPPAHEEASRQGNPDVSENLSGVIDRALSVKPEGRFPSVGEFCQEFLTNLIPKVSGPRKLKAFISYRRDSASGWAALFAQGLDRQGISAFVDTARKDKVVRFPRWLEEAIIACDVFVCFLSENTLESNWVHREIRVAWKHGKPMIPVFQEDFKFPEPSAKLEKHIKRLLTFQGVTLFDRKGEYIDASIQQLSSMIQQSAAGGLPTKSGKPSGK